MLPADLPLDDRRFRRVFAAEAISLFGSGLAPVALVFAVLGISGAAGVGIVLAARQVPLVALLLGGGVVADRQSPRTLLVAADLARAITQGLTAALLLTGSAEVWHLVVLQALYGAAEAFSGPAQTGLIADVVAPERLQAANSLRAFAQSAASVGGPAIAGVLVVAAGAGWGLAADAVSFAVSAALLLSVRVPERARVVAAGFVSQLREGWAAFRQLSWLRNGVATMSVHNCVFSVYLVLGPVISEQDRGGAAAWAAISTAYGIGSLAGGLALVRFRPRRPGLLLTIGLVVASAPALALATGAPLAVVVAAGAVAGAGLVGFNATWESAVQREVPRESLSRVISYDLLGSFALVPVGYAAGGLLAEPLGATTALLGAGLLLAVLPALLWANPGIRALRG